MIGTIDGSHIPIKAPRDCPENYINRLKIYMSSTYYKLAVIMNGSSPPVTVSGLEVLMTLECYEIKIFFYYASNKHYDFFPKNSHLLGDAAYISEKLLRLPVLGN